MRVIGHCNLAIILVKSLYEI